MSEESKASEPVEKIALGADAKTLFKYLDQKIAELQQELQIMLYQRQANLSSILRENKISEGRWRTDEDYNVVLVQEEEAKVEVEECQKEKCCQEEGVACAE